MYNNFPWSSSKSVLGHRGQNELMRDNNQSVITRYTLSHFTEPLAEFDTKPALTAKALLSK